MSGRIFLITGGARSGKSTYAESLAKRLCPEESRRCYIATAQAIDSEMQSRIQKHKQRRGNDFYTVEAPIQLGSAIKQQLGRCDVILVDCLTIWTSNLLYYNKISEKDDLLATLHCLHNPSTIDGAGPSSPDIVLVTNETGMGIVPDNKLSRDFRDLAGFINQDVAKIADTVVLMVCGLPMFVKGSI